MESITCDTSGYFTIQFQSLQSQLLNAKSGFRNPDQIVRISESWMDLMLWWTILLDMLVEHPMRLPHLPHYREVISMVDKNFELPLLTNY